MPHPYYDMCRKELTSHIIKVNPTVNPFEIAAWVDSLPNTSAEALYLDLP